MCVSSFSDPYLPLHLMCSFFPAFASCYPSFSRGGSVRDRVRKFTEPAEVSTEKRNVQRSVHRGTFTSNPAYSEPEDHAQDFSSSLPSFSDSRVNLDQSEHAVGRPQCTSENVRSACCSSEEGETPRGTASSDTQEVQGDPYSNMKAFLTIEIKDGRTSATQTSSSSSSTSISGAMPRILTSSAAQRTGRILYLAIRRCVPLLIVCMHDDVQVWGRDLTLKWNENAWNLFCESSVHILYRKLRRFHIYK